MKGIYIDFVIKPADEPIQGEEEEGHAKKKAPMREEATKEEAEAEVVEEVEDVGGGGRI